MSSNMTDSDDAELDLDSVFTVSDSTIRLARIHEKRTKARSHQGHRHPSPRSQHIEEKLEQAKRHGSGLRSPFASLARIRCGDTICTQYSTHSALSVTDPIYRWNASRSFATYLDDHTELYRDRAVLELGAGGGLPGIVAANNGARTVGHNTFFVRLVLTESSCTGRAHGLS